MPGCMSINWLLNEDDESDMSPDQPLPAFQGQDTRWAQDQESRGACSDAHSYPPTDNGLSYLVNQQQYHLAHPTLTMRQHRASSVSSRTGSTSRSTQPRAPRPKYSAEEDHFIWYQRIDLEKDWKEVSHSFNEYFRDRHRDGESGLQCRFYRILDAAGIPNIRSLKNSSDKERIAQFGLVQQTRYRYSWMLPRHRAA